MRRAVINFSSSKYKKGQERLKKSLQDNTDADIFMFSDYNEINSPTHHENMYAFKPYSFSKVLSKGYDVILWFDASMFVLKDITPIFDHIEKHGYMMQDSGWVNSRWTTPKAKEYFGTDKGKMISSGVVGLDFNNLQAQEFFSKWNEAMMDGMFNGSHNDYRHDQSCASLIIENLKMEITPNNTYWTYGTPEQTHTDNILILAHGIC